MKTDCAPLQDVDVGGAGAGVQQGDDAAGLEAVVGLVGVLQGEGVDVHDDRRAPGLGDDAGVVADLVLLRRHQQHVHGALRRRRGDQDLVVEVHVLDVEGDVLLGFPVDGLGELLLGHRRQRDLLDDDRVTGQRRRDVLGPELGVGEQAPDGVGDRAAVDDGAIDNAVGRDRLDPDGRDLIALPGGLELDGLHGARPDVEPHQGFASAKEQLSLPASRSPPQRAKAVPAWLYRRGNKIGRKSRFVESGERPKANRSHNKIASV